MHDGLWGNGIPLHQPNCLNQQLWKRQGILGEILQDIWETHIEIAHSLLPANPWFQWGPPNIAPTNQLTSTPSCPNSSGPTTMTPLTNTDRPLTPGDGDGLVPTSTICTQAATGTDSDRMQVNPMEVNSQESNSKL